MVDAQADSAPPSRGELVEILRSKGLRRLNEPIELSSGALSNDFVDGKLALAHWDDLELAGRVIVNELAAAGITFDAVGGLTMGADALAIAVAAAARCRWFFVRKQPKGRGTNKVIEGSDLGSADRVVVVDDAVTSGGSILQAVAAVQAVGAEVVAAVTLVDRGDMAAPELAGLDIAYFPMATYHDLAIDPISD